MMFGTPMEGQGMIQSDRKAALRLVAATLLTAAAPALGGTAIAAEAIGTAPAATVSGPVDRRDERIVDMQMQLQAQQEQLAEMSAQLAELKASMTATRTDGRAAQASADKVVIANGKPSIQSADGRFTANLQGVMQFDTAAYFQDDLSAAQTDAHARDLNDGANFRRARIGIGGKMFGDFNYNVLFDFGGTGAEDAGKIQELWLEYAGLKPLRLRVGAFAPLVGLADATSTNGMLFLERPSPAEIARTLAGGDRRTGLQLAGSGDSWLASVAVTGPTISSLNTTASGFSSAPFDEQLGYTGRLAWSPLKGADYRLHVGANASLVSHVADAGPAAATRFPIQLRDRPELTVDGTRLIDTGAVDAEGAHHWGLELGLQKAGFLLEGEYFDIAVERRTAGLGDLDFRGWYAQASWVITGEARKYSTETASWGAPNVRRAFDWNKGQWGALELAVRYSTMNLDDHAGDPLLPTPAGGIRGGEQQIWTAGLNWYLNPVIRFMFDYQHVDVDRLNGAGLQIGQDFDTVAVRSQLAF
jgi:phosphate-selective porin OprO/OprP